MEGAQTLKNSAVFTEIESEFWAEIGTSNDFSAQNQVISKKKKKKKKRSSPKLRVVFQPKSGDLQKKKSLSKLRVVFQPKSGDLQKKKKEKKKKVFIEIESGFSAKIR